MVLEQRRDQEAEPKADFYLNNIYWVPTLYLPMTQRLFWCPHQMSSLTTLSLTPSVAATVASWVLLRLTTRILPQHPCVLCCVLGIQGEQDKSETCARHIVGTQQTEKIKVPAPACFASVAKRQRNHYLVAISINIKKHYRESQRVATKTLPHLGSQEGLSKVRPDG